MQSLAGCWNGDDARQLVHTGQAVALKVQPIDISYPSNPHERQIYPLLQGGLGMPTLLASGLWGRWDYLAIDLLGNTLDRLYRKVGKNVMDLRSTCSIAIQLVRLPPLFSFAGLLLPEGTPLWALTDATGIQRA